MDLGSAEDDWGGFSDFGFGLDCCLVEESVCFLAHRLGFEGEVVEVAVVAVVVVDDFAACLHQALFLLAHAVAVGDSDFVADVAVAEVFAAVALEVVAVVELDDFLLLWQYLLHLQDGYLASSFSSFCFSCSHRNG